VQDLKGLGYEKGKPVGLVGVTELSEAQKKQLKEQQEMQQMYDMIMKHKRAMQEMQMMWEKAIQQHQHGYDSDEEVDSELGTWEHQLRRMEMDKTRGVWGALPPSASLLPQRGGWKPGKGNEVLSASSLPPCSTLRVSVLPLGALTRAGGVFLGRKGGDLTHLLTSEPSFPFSRGTTAVDGAGFGIDRPAELTKEDDEYEAFRKRMMLAYRFRPNPLNNPRRPYY
ncbi:SUGP1 protein, partial [Oreotrochilus melanogaster]|nr:SUGP1 protein [Oreotrochilus melanogaster]